MEFDFDKFQETLKKKALSKQELSELIYEEIRKAESQKVGFLDQATENADFYKYIGSQVDTYITQLKVLHNKIDSDVEEKPDAQVYESDKKIINKTLDLVKHLEQVEKNSLNNSQEEQQKTNLNDRSSD